MKCPECGSEIDNNEVFCTACGAEIINNESEGMEKKPEKTSPEGVDYTAEAQKDLSSRLGRGVKIVSGKKKGKIELEYYGLVDLNDLLDALALLQVKKTK